MRSAPRDKLERSRLAKSRIKVRRVDHVALHVRDLRCSADFYRRVFGFQVVHRWKTTWMIGNRAIRVGLFRRSDAHFIENADDWFIIAHVAFLVKDRNQFESVLETLDELALPHEGVEDTGIAKSVFFKDPDSHLLEVTYYYKKAPRY